MLAEHAPALPFDAAPARTARHRRAGRLAAAAIVLYATLALLALAIPGSIVSTLRDAGPNAFTAVALPLAERWQARLEGIGLAGIYARAKARFRAIACGGPDSADPC